ncbi:MAG: hypothetical protein JW751_10875 [Polyangiaceae bacterium]|nr:hypothetical protein [Polyangiaceae bacterium]
MEIIPSTPLFRSNIDETTRRAMLYELALDVCVDARCPSPLLNRRGRALIVGVLYEALADYDERWLANQMEQYALVGPCSVEAAEDETSNGRIARSLVPVVARALAQQLFNRYYARGVCRVALERGDRVVEVCPTGLGSATGDEQMSGTTLRAEALIEELRSVNSVDDALGLAPHGEERFTVCFARRPPRAATRVARRVQSSS